MLIEYLSETYHLINAINAIFNLENVIVSIDLIRDI